MINLFFITLLANNLVWNQHIPIAAVEVWLSSDRDNRVNEFIPKGVEIAKNVSESERCFSRIVSGHVNPELARCFLIGDSARRNCVRGDSGFTHPRPTLAGRGPSLADCVSYVEHDTWSVGGRLAGIADFSRELNGKRPTSLGMADMFLILNARYGLTCFSPISRVTQTALTAARLAMRVRKRMSTSKATPTQVAIVIWRLSAAIL